MKFEDMDVWKRSSRLSVDVYRHFFDCKDYGYKDQVTRSSLSIPSNIAEGIERISAKDTRKFLSYAKGSCAELRTQIYIGMEIGYIPKATGIEWVRETKEISLMLFSLMKYLDTHTS